jgi:hypothetical protein
VPILVAFLLRDWPHEQQCFITFITTGNRRFITTGNRRFISTGNRHFITPGRRSPTAACLLADTFNTAAQPLRSGV